MKVYRYNFLAGAAMVSVAVIPLAAAQSFPDKPIRLVVAAPAGGGADNVARPLAHKLSESWGRQVVVDNRPPSSGFIAIPLVAESAPDGYTIILGTASAFAVNPNLMPNLRPLRDLRGVSLIATGDNLIAVHPALPARTIRELVTLARKNPKQLAFASNGTGSLSHLAMELFQKAAGVTMLHVPYKGGTQAMIDVMAGHVALLFGSIPATMPFVRSGKLRAIATTGIQRSATLEKVPTVAETIPGYEAVQWWAVFAPAKTPDRIVEILNLAIVRALRSDDVKNVLTAMGSEVVASSATELQNVLRRDSAKWEKVFKTVEAKPDN